MTVQEVIALLIVALVVAAALLRRRRRKPGCDDCAKAGSSRLPRGSRKL